MRHTIAVVDNDLDTLRDMEQMLASDYDVLTMASGKDAFEVMSMPPFPSLIIINFELPDINSLDLFAQISDNIILRNVPVIFLIGECDDSIEKCLLAGAADYVRMPYFNSVVRKRVDTQIRLKMLNEEMSAIASSNARRLEEYADELMASHGAIIMGMSILSESRDKVTGAHLTRIKGLTAIIADKFASMFPEALSFHDASIVTTYSPLHDVGKVGVPDAVLKKQGGLTPEEFEQIKSHTTSGGDLLRQIVALLPKEQERLNVAIEIAEGHHEKFDGTGYPHGLKGEEIPLSARIVTLADIYDALRSPRPYKAGFTHEETMDIILVGDGRTSPNHFDPRVLEVACEVHLELKETYDSNPDTEVVS